MRRESNTPPTEWCIIIHTEVTLENKNTRAPDPLCPSNELALNETGTRNEATVDRTKINVNFRSATCTPPPPSPPPHFTDNKNEKELDSTHYHLDDGIIFVSLPSSTYTERIVSFNRIQQQSESIQQYKHKRIYPTEKCQAKTSSGGFCKNIYISLWRI